MSDDEQQKQRSSASPAPAVGTARKADATGASADEPPAQRQKVTSEDLAFALGGCSQEPVKEEAPGAPDYGLKEGDRMEVRWVISEGEETNPTETIVWWGCTLRPAPDDADPAPGVWELHYDANVDLGFAAEIRPVQLTGAGTLEDPGEGTTLRWRLEGSTDDVDDSFDRGDDEDEADPDVVHVAEPIADAAGNVSVHEMMRAQREVDARRNGGRSLEEHGLEAFATMPMDRQQKMATAFAGLKDGLVHAFAELQARNGPDYAITKEDIAEIMERMRG